MNNTFAENDITYFAETNFRNEKRKFGVKRDDRRRHFYVVGKTGMGKSVMLSNMIIQDIERGEGLAVVDPHGELAEEIVASIPPERINDVIYFNPSDLQYPIAFNILENVDEEYKHLVGSGLMGVFTKIWAGVWSSRMEYILNNCILALLDSPGNTLLGINRLLVNKDYRRKIVNNIKDPVVKTFWVDEYANYNERFRTEAIAPIQNKVGQFLSSAVIRNIVGQSNSSFDLREIMDDRKILIMNLSKGRVGEDNSALLGAMMITKLQLAAMSRINIPEKERKDFYLYVDEFQNFATESFAEILSEARKYRLSLIMAHQYMAQLIGSDHNSKVKDAVFGNVGTIVSFRVGSPDAEELIKEYEPYFIEEDLINLSKYHIYLKLMIDGVASKPFSATTLPPLAKDNGDVVEKVIKVSRERYANAREDVEEKIMRWAGLSETMEESGKGNRLEGDEAMYKSGHIVGDKNEDEPTPNAVCDNCNNPLYIKFTPDDKRNVFCKECLPLFKAGKISGDLPRKNVAQKIVEEKVVSKEEVIKSREEIVKPHDSRVITENKKDSDTKDDPEVKKVDLVDRTGLQKVQKEIDKQNEISLEQAVQQVPQDINDSGVKNLAPGQVVKFD